MSKNKVTVKYNKLNIDEIGYKELLEYFVVTYAKFDMELNQVRKNMFHENLNLIKDEILKRMKESKVVKL